MQIISMIIQYLSGGTFNKTLTDYPLLKATLNDQQYHCDKIYWEKTPKGDVYVNGTLARKCLIYVPNVTDVRQLLKATKNQVVTASERVLSESPETTSTGITTKTYAHELSFNTSRGADNKIQGTTQIDSNNSSYLKNTFKATTFPKYGAASYFRDLSEEVEITKLNNSGWYEVKIRSFSKVLRPAFAPNVTFQDQIQSGFEKKFEEKSLSILSQIYSNM
jgi:hypothetical protein